MLVIGTLVGLEIPLIMRILEGTVSFKDLVSRVLTFDYLGALAAAVMFPLRARAAARARAHLADHSGVLNAGVALWGTWLLGDRLGRPSSACACGPCVVLVGMIAGAGVRRSVHDVGRGLDVLGSRWSTRRPRRTSASLVTRGRSGFNLFLNGNLQFASADEYRYHEALVHPAMVTADARRGAC